MKNLKKYINTIYPPAFILLCLGLSIFVLTLTILAVNMRIDMLTNKTDILFRYPDMLEKIIFPLYILMPIVFIVDLNERNKKS